MQTKADDWRDEAQRFRGLFGLLTSHQSQEQQCLRRAMTVLDEFSNQIPEEAYRRIGLALVGRADE